MVIQITTKEYEILVDWWKQRGFPVLAREMLPDTSYMYYDGAKPIIFCVLYMPANQECKTALSSWFTANPNTSVEERLLGLQQLDEFTTKVCKERGATNILCFSSKENLTKNLSLCGYQPIEQGTFSIKYI